MTIGILVKKNGAYECPECDAKLSPGRIGFPFDPQNCPFCVAVAASAGRIIQSGPPIEAPEVPQGSQTVGAPSTLAASHAALIAKRDLDPTRAGDRRSQDVTVGDGSGRVHTGTATGVSPSEGRPKIG